MSIQKINTTSNNVSFTAKEVVVSENIALLGKKTVLAVKNAMPDLYQLGGKNDIIHVDVFKTPKLIEDGGVGRMYSTFSDALEIKAEIPFSKNESTNHAITPTFTHPVFSSKINSKKDVIALAKTLLNPDAARKAEIGNELKTLMGQAGSIVKGKKDFRKIFDKIKAFKPEVG